MRSTTRRQNLSTSAVLADAIAYLRSADFDLVIVETAGIGQSDSEIVDLVDLPVYVMTSEFGAASQLEKIDMLDLAEIVVINKFDKQGAAEFARDVRKQWRRNRAAFELAEDEVPVYPTIASQFADPGVTWMFAKLCAALAKQAGTEAERWDPHLDQPEHGAARQHPDPRAAGPLPGRDRRAGAGDQRAGGGAGGARGAPSAPRRRARRSSARTRSCRRAPRRCDPQGGARPRGARTARVLGRADRGHHRRELQLRGPRA